jgi:hypothetical protein
MLITGPPLAGDGAIELTAFRTPLALVRRFLAGPTATRLTRFTYSAAEDESALAAAAAVAAAPSLPRLEELHFHRLMTGDELSILLAAPNMPALRHLTLMQHPRAAEPAAALTPPLLARLAPKPGLEKLHLFDFQLADGALRALANTTSLPGLEDLWLRCNITDAGVGELLDGPLCDRLRLLYLDHNQITDDGAAALAAAPFPRLIYLNFLYNSAGPRGRDLLRRRFGDAVKFEVRPAVAASAE